jgi:ribosome-binding factor A
LAFVLDELPESADQINELLERAARADAEVQQARVGAQPAGEADPYRKPREDDDE